MKSLIFCAGILMGCASSALFSADYKLDAFALALPWVFLLAAWEMEPT